MKVIIQFKMLSVKKVIDTKHIIKPYSFINNANFKKHLYIYIFIFLPFIPTEGAPAATAARAYSIWTNFPEGLKTKKNTIIKGSAKIDTILDFW